MDNSSLKLLWVLQNQIQTLARCKITLVKSENPLWKRTKMASQMTKPIRWPKEESLRSKKTSKEDRRRRTALKMKITLIHQLLELLKYLVNQTKFLKNLMNLELTART